MAITSSISFTPRDFLRFDATTSLWDAPASSITSIALSGNFRSCIYREESSTAVLIASNEYFTSWCSSNLDFNPFNIFIVSSILGSITSTFWNLLASARSFSKCCLYSLYVVDPIQRSFPPCSAGFNKFEASIAPPEVAPAPITVCISSINNTASGCSSNSVITDFRRSSKSPRYLVPANKDPMSSEYIVVSVNISGVSPEIIFTANPSAIAVLPTPGSPTKIGLFFRLRHKICIHLSTSWPRPIKGSIFPSLAWWFKSTQYFDNAVSSASETPSSCSLNSSEPVTSLGSFIEGSFATPCAIKLTASYRVISCSWRK